jgi:hypothetical protein
MTPFIAKLIERSCVTTHANCPLDDLIANSCQTPHWHCGGG